VILYATLGPTLPDDAAEAAAMWGICHVAAQRDPLSIQNAGFEGEGPMLAEALFAEVLSSRIGVVFASNDAEDSWRRVTTIDGKLHVDIPEMLALFAEVPNEPVQLTSGEYPLVLAAGERRSFTANTILRNPDWRKRDRTGALRISPADAGALGIGDGGSVRVSTAGGSVTTIVEITDTVLPGHITLPNGLGLDNPDADGESVRTGAPPNELTYTGHQDPFAHTPWHKHVPARVEAIG
jgi:anaerobic selenocysteine-containing dehydrogenase